ncbi:MAG: hypothetical protein D6748_12800 [Calditrichaeota bacterium]|nr:MAG: hypothetical protein D6748_12800 [Calditrichota bacterium]
MKKRGLVWVVLSFLLMVGITVNSCLSIPDAVPPTLFIISPAPGAVVTGNVEVIAVASDDNEVSEVKIFVDGKEMASSDKNTVTFQWNTAPYADNQNHYISGYARDKDDNFGVAPTVAVRVARTAAGDTLPPTLVIQNPVNGQVVSGLVNVVVQASDNSGVDSVQYYIDGIKKFTDSSEPFVFQWDVTDSVNGSFHTIFARGFDPGGFNSVSPVIGVTVNSNVIADITPPSVTILYPPAGSVFSASNTSNIVVVVDVIDNVAADRVEFYVDGIFQSSDNSAPFQFQWNLVPYGDGLTHTLYVKGYDTSGNLSTALIPITINP